MIDASKTNIKKTHAGSLRHPIAKQVGEPGGYMGAHEGVPGHYFSLEIVPGGAPHIYKP